MPRHRRRRTELVRLLESIGDPTLTLALLATALSAKQETGEMSEVLRLAERGIDLAGGDPTKGKMMTGSPLTLALAMRGMARCCLGIAGWRDDFERAVSMARTAEPITRSAALYFTYVAAICKRCACSHGCCSTRSRRSADDRRAVGRERRSGAGQAVSGHPSRAYGRKFTRERFSVVGPGSHHGSRAAL